MAKFYCKQKIKVIESQDFNTSKFWRYNKVKFGCKKK